MEYINTYKNLEPHRYFSTIWCTLENSAVDYLHKNLEFLKPYTNWLSTYGDAKLDPKYQPHVSLRYLGYTDELDLNKLKNDKKKFEDIISSQVNAEITVKDFKVWERKENDVYVSARLYWEIINAKVLKTIHNELLKVADYYFYSDLEGKNYNPHISLGDINLAGGNLEKVKEIISRSKRRESNFKLSNFAINIPTINGREELNLSSN